MKNDIPFDLALAGSLIDEIRLLLIDEFEGYSHLSKLPSIKVVTLDDITSALSLLKDYVSTMSSDVTKNNEKRTRLINQLKEQIVSLQAEAKESTEKIHELEEELEMKDNDLATSTHQLRISTEEKNKIWSQVLQQKEQVMSCDYCHVICTSITVLFFNIHFSSSMYYFFCRLLN